MATTVVTTPSRSSPGGAAAVLPTNVSTREQLALLPLECVSDENPQRPLRHVTESGKVQTYALQPMWYSVIIILLVELLERFCYYGIAYTQTSYLTGVYNRHWNAGLSAVEASTYVSVSVAVAYTTPFVGAYLADQSGLGDYASILVGALVFYFPGLLLTALTSIPGFLTDSDGDFSVTALAFGLLFLWPFGTGIVKGIVNVFGAKQHHPLLQQSLVESYYVNFYMCINTGALIGGMTVPVVAQHDITLAYAIPVVALALGIGVFVLGSPRYVHDVKNQQQQQQQQQQQRKKLCAGGNNDISLWTIFRILVLILPFTIAYSQQATIFIVQGNVMNKALGVVDAACMNNLDTLSVLFFGYVVGNHLYPALAKRGIKLATTTKFAIGSAFGALALLWALLVEHWIHQEYHHQNDSVSVGTGFHHQQSHRSLSSGWSHSSFFQDDSDRKWDYQYEYVHDDDDNDEDYNDNLGKISVLWQTGSYLLIGMGEIFAVASAYEAAFKISPPNSKVLASAVNIFCIGGLSNVLCIGLYHVCAKWFENSHDGTANLLAVRDYASARVGNYFWVLFGIAIAGVVVNLLPSVRNFVESVEQRAVELAAAGNKTPKTPSPATLQNAASPFTRIKRHHAYLKYGTEKSLYRHGSMRAGPPVVHQHEEDQQASSSDAERRMLRRDELARLYRGSNPHRVGPPSAAIPIPQQQQVFPPQTQPQNEQEDTESSPLLGTGLIRTGSLPM